MELVEALPEVAVGLVAGLPGLAAPAALVASWLLPAAPKESGPAAASAEWRSCEEETYSSVTQSQTEVILCFLIVSILYEGKGGWGWVVGGPVIK